MLNTRGDIGHDFGQFRLSIRTIAVGKDPHRCVVFSDPVDPSGKLILGAEGGLEKSVRYLAVGECLLFGALARCNGGNFGRRSRQPGNAVERDAGEDNSEHPQDMRRRVESTHCIDAAVIGEHVQGLTYKA